VHSCDWWDVCDAEMLLFVTVSSKLVFMQLVNADVAFRILRIKSGNFYSIHLSSIRVTFINFVLQILNKTSRDTGWQLAFWLGHFQVSPTFLRPNCYSTFSVDNTESWLRRCNNIFYDINSASSVSYRRFKRSLVSFHSNWLFTGPVQQKQCWYRTWGGRENNESPLEVRRFPVNVSLTSLLRSKETEAGVSTNREAGWTVAQQPPPTLLLVKYRRRSDQIYNC
jgi:hypothetical protein